jgi:RsiW-degrading membrane proteinase PrsW (M82 family)
VAVLVAVAFIPSVIYLVWIRNAERFSREPFGKLLVVFAYGAIVSVLIAIVFELLLMGLFNRNLERVYQFLGENPTLEILVLACIVAPLVEEASKGLGARKARRSMTELENGIVYGAAAGLGFAATENLMYESMAYFSDGAQAWMATAVLRSFSSALLHATASSLLGLGIARSVTGKGSWIPYYLGAVAIHAAFNFAASFGTIYEDSLGEVAYTIGIAAALMLAIVGILTMRQKIRTLDNGHSRRVRRLRKRAGPRS